MINYNELVDGNDFLCRKRIWDERSGCCCAYCLTYNHAPYIRATLEGFLMQKTTRPLRVLIHDDASTDGTQSILREYERKYPDFFGFI